MEKTKKIWNFKISIPDPNLDEETCENLNKPQGSIYSDTPPFRKIDITPTWKGLSGLVINDIEFSNLPTRHLAITLLTDMAEILDTLLRERSRNPRDSREK